MTEYINLDVSDPLYKIIFVVFVGSLIATVPIMISLYISGLEEIIEENEENEIDKLLNEAEYEK